MEFSNFDVRSAADRGAFMQLHHPQTDEPLFDSDGQAVGFVTRGIAAREGAEEIVKARKAATSAGNAHEIHESEIKVAMACIIEARNIDWNGEAVGKNMNLIRKVLDSTFPEVRFQQEDEVKPGQEPDFDYLNNPFAKQVVRFAGRQSNFLGNSAGGSS